MQPTPVDNKGGGRPRRAALGALLLAGCGSLMPGPAWAAAPAAAPGLGWGIPFVGMLLSIALLPMLHERLWHRRMGLIALFWALALLVPQAASQGVTVAAHAAWHAILAEYLPFVTMLLALFATGGGILVRGGPAGTPAGNTGLLAIGTGLAGLMGTTGAAMVLVHPLLRANAHRSRKIHLVVFFILLVANAGGATTPLGDPPLYLGFLRGVPFFWPIANLLLPLLVVAGILLPGFYLLDRRYAAEDPPPPQAERFRIRGWLNIGLLGAIVATVLAQGFWHPGEVSVFGQSEPMERLAGMAVFLCVAAVSVLATPNAVRQGNMFSWDPMAEVAKLFAAIFVTIAPVLAMLQAGFDGPLAAVLRLTLDGNGHPWPAAYFWLTGLLSAFLDNAPTYLVFFELAGGDPAHLTGPLHTVLQAISSSAVFFGALTYIGNAPNMMIRSIAAHRGVRMPSFFGFMAWSCGLMLPIFVLLTLLFYR